MVVGVYQYEKADMVVGVYQYEIQIPYGVIETDGIEITGISEKPMVQRLVNAGIYILSPQVRRYIPTGQSYNMTDLIRRLLMEKRRVVSFPIHEYWVDIGHIADYELAQGIFEKEQKKV